MAARVLLLLFALFTGALGIGAAARLEVKAGYYECPHCGALFVPTMADYVKGLHTLTRRRLTCPACGKTSMCPPTASHGKRAGPRPRPARRKTPQRKRCGASLLCD